jgi:DNA-binding NarL/FixJ family response regulator
MLHAMRVVVCDEDALLLGAVEDLLGRLGHDVIGVAGTSSGAIHLIQAARPHVVIIDPAIGYNSDFDMVDAALAVDATPLIFTHGAGDLDLERYTPRPLLVEKPDLVGLETVLVRLDLDGDQGIVEHERRTRPGRAAQGPVPMGPTDAAAFYEALNAAVAGDALVSLELPSSEAAPISARIAGALRSTDRLLASATAVRLLLPAAGETGITSVLCRIAEAASLPPDTRLGSVIVEQGEEGAAAFDRLRHAPRHHALPTR